MYVQSIPTLPDLHDLSLNEMEKSDSVRPHLFIARCYPLSSVPVCSIPQHGAEDDGYSHHIVEEMPVRLGYNRARTILSSG